MKAPIYNIAGKQVGEIELSEKIFSAHWNPDLVRQALLAQVSNRRNSPAHARMRGEVSGGGKKPWRQKGTGRARHGSTRSPIWKGGGVTHGPRNTKDYSVKINKKMRVAALRSVVSKKLADGSLKFVDALTIKEPKTKILVAALRGFVKPAKKEKLSTLIVPTGTNRMIYRTSANIPSVKAMSPNSINIEDLLGHQRIVIEEKAVAELKI